MSTATAQTGAHQFEVHATSDSHLAWLRTRMAAERTFMAWLCTAVSMTGFGFTIAQFFERFASTEGVKSGLAAGGAALPWACAHRGGNVFGSGFDVAVPHAGGLPVERYLQGDYHRQEHDDAGDDDIDRHDLHRPVRLIRRADTGRLTYCFTVGNFLKHSPIGSVAAITGFHSVEASESCFAPSR